MIGDFDNTIISIQDFNFKTNSIWLILKINLGPLANDFKYRIKL